MAKKSVKKATRAKKKPSRSSKKEFNQGLAIVALIVNILFLPGLGTLIAGRTKTGVWQLVLFGIGVVLSIILIGIPLVIAAWIWGIVTGVQLVQESM